MCELFTMHFLLSERPAMLNTVGFIGLYFKENSIVLDDLPCLVCSADAECVIAACGATPSELDADDAKCADVLVSFPLAFNLVVDVIAHIAHSIMHVGIRSQHEASALT